MLIRAVVFDLFDTLVDLVMGNPSPAKLSGSRPRTTHRALHELIVQRDAVDFETFAETLRAVDRELRARIYAEGRELPTVERFAELTRRLGLADEDLPEALTRVHMQAIYEMATYVPHHAEVLAVLGVRRSLAVCSNFSHTRTAHRVLEAAGLRAALDAIVISEQVGIRKPRPEIFEAVLHELGLTASEAIHVGDNLVADVDGAARVGMRTVWLTRRVADPPAALATHAGAEPTWIVGDLSELPSLLDEAESRQIG
jgi:HAD superfamily hydrolase (TIGR01509 family)